MIMSQAISAYRHAKATVPPVTAVVLLYDEALTSLRHAMQATDDKRYDVAQGHVQRAITILRGLRQALDMESGGLIAKQLNIMYTRNISALSLSVGKRDAVERFGKLAAGLAQVRDAWATMTTLGPRGGEPAA